MPTTRSMADVPVAITAGGPATPVRPASPVSSGLVAVAGRPFVDHHLDLLSRHGVRRVVFCVGAFDDRLERHVRAGHPADMSVRFCRDGDALLGSGGAVRRALPALGDLFWVLSGDSYLDIDYPSILARFLGQPAEALLTVYPNRGRWDTSNAVFMDGVLVNYDTRRKAQAMHHIDGGVSLLRSSVFVQASAGEPFALTELYHRLVAEGRMIGHEVFERPLAITSPTGLAEAEARLRRRASAA